MPGVESHELPVGSISRFLYNATRFLEDIDDALPGSGSSWFKLLPNR